MATTANGRDSLGPSAFNADREVGHRQRMATDIQNGYSVVTRIISEVHWQLRNVTPAFEHAGQTDILRANILVQLDDLRNLMGECLGILSTMQERAIALRFAVLEVERAHSRPLQVPRPIPTTKRLKDMEG